MKWDLLAFVYLFFQKEVHDDGSLKEMGQDLLRLESVTHYGNKLRPEEKLPNQFDGFHKKKPKTAFKNRWTRSVAPFNLGR